MILTLLVLGQPNHAEGQEELLGRVLPIGHVGAALCGAISQDQEHITALPPHGHQKGRQWKDHTIQMLVLRLWHCLWEDELSQRPRKEAI